MARERQEITEWTYPYNAVDCMKNMKEYGVGPALSHDWKRTKEDIGHGLEKIVLGVLAGAAICIATPIIIYRLCKVYKRLNKRQERDNETLK